MNLYRFIFSAVLSVLLLFARAQDKNMDTAVSLREVQILDDRFHTLSSGTKITTIDSSILQTFQSSNLADLLSSQNSLFVKSYGSGSLATTSFRGGSANHTAILWNGFNLNSPMFGHLDISLIPVSFSDKISLQHGGTSALWGSGAVGGTIHLNNLPGFDKGFSASAGGSFGSFDDYKQNVSVQWSRKRFISSLKFFNHTSKNNFPFYNSYTEDNLRQKQSNSELKQYGIISENYYKINAHQKINVRFWYQYSDRNIPPTMLQALSRAGQKDETYRITSEWQRTGEKTIVFVRVAYFDESLVYNDEAYHLHSVNRSKRIIMEAEGKINLWRGHKINLGINDTYAQAEADGYLNIPSQNHISFFSSYNYSNKKLDATLSARQEIINNAVLPFTYSLGVDYKATNWLLIYMNGAKVYRTPTFNDRYWNPGGNPDLLAEDGFSEEAGLRFIFNAKKIRSVLTFEPTVFNRNMKNWIVWLPAGGYWTPRNILNVWSRGMETRTELKTVIRKWIFKIGINTNYVVSTNQKAINSNDASVDKQLIYVPMYSGQAYCSIEFSGFCFLYNHTYTGYRYTSTDNTEYLKPFHLDGIRISKSIQLKKLRLSLSGQINNLFNVEYQVIQNRPMPLMNYQAGISIQFN